MNGKKYTAIVLAAGQGKRMNSETAKQYLILRDKPVLYYSLEAFEKSPVHNIILVVGKGEIEYCKKEVIEKYGFTKVSHIIEGGAERYHSVYQGLNMTDKDGYVLIHDGARPFLEQDMIQRILDTLEEELACIAAVPSKDTIKIVDEKGYVSETPDRNSVWQVQTPQAFKTEVIRDAYDKLMKEDIINVTDDAMVFELMSNQSVKIVIGSYRNIKITTREDLLIGERLLDCN